MKRVTFLLLPCLTSLIVHIVIKVKLRIDIVDIVIR